MRGGLWWYDVHNKIHNNRLLQEFLEGEDTGMWT
jgi:hypothetical protein